MKKNIKQSLAVDVHGLAVSKENKVNVVEALTSILDWMIEKDRRVKCLTEWSHPEKRVFEDYFPNLGTHKDADKYKYCCGDNELKKEVDEIEHVLRCEGVLFNTYVLRQIFLFCKYGITGTFSIFVDDELLVKFELTCKEKLFSFNVHKASNMLELIDRVN